MATSDGAIILSVEIDESSMNNALSGLKSTSGGMNTLNAATQNVTTSLKKFASVIGTAFSVSQIVKFSKEAGELASQTEAYLTRMGTLYGSVAQDVYDWVNANSYALGMSKSTAYEAVAQYGNLFTTFATATESAELSIEMLQATAVVASQTGRTYEETFEKIQSGIYGNTRAIDDLGISVRRSSLMQTKAWQTVSQNGKKSWNDLTDAELQQLRVLGIIEQSTEKYGNEVMQTTALARAHFNAAWTDFKATWGIVVNSVLIPVLNVLTKIINTITAGLTWIVKFMGMSNELGKSTANISDNIDDETSSQKAYNKELKKTLAGFDDLQILQDNNDTNNSESESVSVSEIPSEAGLPGLSAMNGEVEIAVNTTAWDNLLQTLNEIKDIFLSGFWEAFKNADFSGITSSINGIKNALINIWTSPEITNSIQNFGKTFTYALGQFVGGIASIGTTIATNLLGGFSKYLSANAPFIQESISKIFDAGAYIFQSVGNLWSAFSNIFSVFAEENGTDVMSSVIGIFSNAALGISELAMQIGADFINLLTKPIVDNQEQLKAVLGAVLGYFSNIISGIKILIDGIVENAVELYEKHLSPLINSIITTISNMVAILIDKWQTYIQPIMERIGEEFQKLVQEKIKPMIDKVSEFIGNIVDIINHLWVNVLGPIVEWIWNTMVTRIFRAVKNIADTVWDVLKGIISFISDTISNIMDILNGYIEFFTGIFTGDFEKALGGLKKVFSSNINQVISIAETAVNFIIDGLNLFVSGIDSIVGAIGDIFGQDWQVSKIQHIEIPRLAQGAVIPANQEFLAVLGDQKHGTNIEAPAELIKQMAKEAYQEMGLAGGQQVIKEDHYYLNQTELMKIMYKLAKGGERLNGTSLVKQGGI